MNNVTIDLRPYFGELQSHSLGAASQFSDNTPISFFLEAQDRLGAFLRQSGSGSNPNQVSGRRPAPRRCTNADGAVIPCNAPGARSDGVTRGSQWPYIITDEGGVSGSPTPTAGQQMPPTPRPSGPGWKVENNCSDSAGNAVPEGTPGAQCSPIWVRDAGVKDAIQNGIKIFPDGFLESFSVGGDTFNAMAFGVLALLLVIAGIYLMK